MKVIAQTAALQEALALAGTIVSARTPKPVLQCVKLVASEGMLTILATDLEAALRYQVSAVQIEQEGEALVPADRLAGIVRESADEESLTIEADADACHVTGAAAHFKILGYDPGEYPTVAEFAGDADFQVPAATLAKMIGKTLFATAKAHSHYAISGVLWEAGAKKIQLVATDGHRLALAKGALAKTAARDVSAIVPAKLMNLMQRVAVGGEEMLDVRIEENQILLRTARAVLISSLVQGNFPKYGDVIPKDFTRKVTVKRANFEHRIRQAALLTNEESRGVRLKFQDKQVTLSSRAPEAGEAQVNCEITLEGEPMDIAFNPSFLIEAMRVVELEDVTLEMMASNKPAVVKAGNDFLYVIMPVDLG
ncbi:MAG: DNA polymerase III subunit beta [Planctomycetaceae bacterium]|nr:DNA polymerase III subunit beta [Planctomycetaceae bacterium]